MICHVKHLRGLADEARREPVFSLRLNTEAIEFLRERGRVTGVRYRAADGTTGELRATLRWRAMAGARSPGHCRNFGSGASPARWTRGGSGYRGARTTPRLVGNAGNRFITVMIDRGSYWQRATLIPKGTDGERRAAGLGNFMAEFAAVAPWLGDRAGALRSWDEVKLLDVRLDRLRRWHRPGLLCIGNAAPAD